MGKRRTGFVKSSDTFLVVDPGFPRLGITPNFGCAPWLFQGAAEETRPT